MKRRVLLGLMIGAASAWAQTLPKEVKLGAEREEVTVSVFRLEEPLHIRPAYEDRDDIEAYAWLRPLLFYFNGYALTIPDAEWEEYAVGEWTQERVNSVTTDLIAQRRECLDNPYTQGNDALYYELAHVVSCKVGHNRFLGFRLTKKLRPDDEPVGDKTVWLQLEGKKWKNPNESDLPEKRTRQITFCCKEALKLVKEKQLAAQPIDRLETGD